MSRLKVQNSCLDHWFKDNFRRYELIRGNDEAKVHWQKGRVSV